jgi:hypothetical protein
VPVKWPKGTFQAVRLRHETFMVQGMTWKDLYISAIRRPESVQALLEQGLAAAQASDDAGLRRAIAVETATPFKLCAALDAHGVDVPPEAVERVQSPASMQAE